MARSAVVVRFTGDTSSLKRAVAEVDGKMKGLGSKVGAFAKTAGVGLAAAGTGLAVLGKSAVDAGSDLNETLSKSNTVFGDQAKAIEKWADSADKNIGQSKQQALEAASSFGNMFTQLGIGEKTAADMSTQMTELASDFASFHNADITEVLTAQQAAFRGEYDALQRFVPTINAAAVEQEALRRTGKKTTKELTLQEKALAVQSLMMKGAGDAAGDFARTSDGLANKQRIMSAQFENVKAKIGQALIPMVLKLGDVFLNKVVPAVQQMAAVVRKHWPQIQATIQSAVQGIRNFVVPIVQALQALWQNFGNNILTFVKRVWPAIAQYIRGALAIIRGVIQTVTALIKGDWSGVWNGIKSIVSGVWQAIQGIVRTALEGIRAVLGVGLEIIGSIFKSAWNGIVGWFWSIPGKVRDIASRAWQGLKSGLGAVVNWIREQLDRLLGPIDEIVGKVGGLIGSGRNSVDWSSKLGIEEHDTGGIVGGRKGAPRLILAHGGETVLPTHKGPVTLAGGGGGGVTYNLNMSFAPGTDMAAAGRTIVEAISAYERKHGRRWRAS